LIPQLEGQDTRAFDGIYISWSHPYSSIKGKQFKLVLGNENYPDS